MELNLSTARRTGSYAHGRRSLAQQAVEASPAAVWRGLWRRCRLRLSLIICDWHAVFAYDSAAGLVVKTLHLFAIPVINNVIRPGFLISHSMQSEQALQSTLRLLMSVPLTLRSNVSVFHQGKVSNFSLEVSRSAEGGLSVVELCPDGELLTGRVVAGPGEVSALDEHALSAAMGALWMQSQDDDPPLSEVTSVRATSLLLATEGPNPFRVVQSWYYRVVDGLGPLDVWDADHALRSREVRLPAADSFRGLVLALQTEANRMG